MNAMPDRSSSQAEAAYRRAVSAYQQGLYEEAHRSARETLALDPAHGGATTLLNRLGAHQTGPQPISTDPTVLIARTGEPTPQRPTEPTVVVPRNMHPRPVPEAPRTPPSPRPRPGGYRSAEPTLIVNPSTTESEPWSSTASTGASASRWRGLWHRGRSPVAFRAPSSSNWTPGARGVLIVVGAVALAVLCVWGAIQGIRWLSPAGEELTVEVGEGGRIEGPGIRCGAGSKRCSTTFSTGERVELTAEAASGFEFAGFTGDCERGGGSLLMDEPKTCGARFERMGSPVASATFTLSIEKPTGGTIVAAGITCGALGSDCSEEVPAGEPVELKFQAEDNYRFDSFYKECGDGEFVMSSARTCGAVFIPAPGGVNRIPGIESDAPERISPRRAPAPPQPASRSATAQPDPLPPPAPAAAVPTGATIAPPANATPEQTLTPQKPPEAPQSQEDHAKGQIKGRVEEYCELRGTLNPARLAKLFHVADERQFRVSFKEYRSLMCSITAPPEYLGFDAGPSGVARIKFEIKETIKLSSGGAPTTSEMVVTMVLSRKSQRSEWLIDRVEHAPKPK